MTPVETKTGRSFKGAAAYYLHDKLEDGQSVNAGTARIAWTENLNLATTDPERGWRMMTHTAIAQAQLKAAAGVKATGRKLTAPVYAYSLAWHPEEKPDRAEQLKAAKETLKSLGLDAHQAIVISHNDTPHPHVHVLVNRVNPETGVAAPLKNSRLKLSEWALHYERAQGLIRSPQREANHERRAQGQAVEAGRVERSAYEAGLKTSNDNLGAEFVKTDQKQKDAQLYAIGRQMEASHGRQRDELNRTYGRMQERIDASALQRKTGRAAEIQDFARVRWRHLFERQQKERDTFLEAERGFLSKLWSMAFVYQTARQMDPKADALTIFYSLISSRQRHEIVGKAQLKERKEMARQIVREIAAAHKKIDVEAGRDRTKLRAEFLARSEQLTVTHQKQKAELQTAWRARNAERIVAYGPLRQRTQARRQGHANRAGRTIRDDTRPRRPPRSGGPGPG
ncbi:relaxase/mobilization nuclease domain-containing protein [Methylobacterium sp. E-065]|uniref:relaxase/mobilization nuclease domain-containing protein n=1 Tax=Methylobacterium sp. E-065 TaxID=2836583 RepID=UPI001FBA1030|nr:relaxase/mobilization nuclease domain-containing protein [Methylobacterium sp. E-065]MCJ2015879.1 relaxase/mobilization nuclease domain-containing protein [Methylobacterium sp. E-065]